LYVLTLLLEDKSEEKISLRSVTSAERGTRGSVIWRGTIGVTTQMRQPRWALVEVSLYVGIVERTLRDEII
jgi:hypothetical protein